MLRAMTARAFLLVALAASCGGSRAPAAAAAAAGGAVSPAAPVVGPAEPPAPAAVSSAPTVLSDEDKRRDRAREPLAAAVVDAFPNSNGLFTSLVARWSPDGSAIVYGSLRNGMPEIYLGDPKDPAAPPRAVTPGPERAIWAGFTADGKSILFLRDQNGDENHAIWRVGLDGSGPVNLTADETMHRDEPLLPRRRPGTIFYSATVTTEPGSRLYQLELSGEPPRRIYSQPLWGGAADVTEDGKEVLFVEFHADDDIIVHAVAVASGKARRVFPAEGHKASLSSAAYAAGGKRILVSTDRGDHVELVALDAETGCELGRYVDQVPTASLALRVSPHGGRVALGVDAGNHGLVRILDARTLRVVRDVKVPFGDVKVGTWRDDGRAFSVLISLPEQPADIFSVDAASGAVTPLRKEVRAGVFSLPALSVAIEDVTSFDGLTVPVNVYLPRVEGTRKLPVLVSFHGGPAFSAAVRWNPFTRFFTALGYAVVEPNVRGSSGFGIAYAMADNREKRADWLKDVAAVNAWVKAQPWCDAERVVAMGGSYGGYTTLMAMTRQPTLWRAGVDLFGMADLRTSILSSSAASRNAWVAEYGDVENDAALLEEFSPMRDVDKIVRPLFVYAGANDPRVPRSEDDAIVKAVRTRGVPVEYMVADNEGHSIDRRENKIELMTRTARFLEDALK
jgi:dipeptidyl aminopeptidase/acylaminoacyl peptidase